MSSEHRPMYLQIQCNPCGWYRYSGEALLVGSTPVSAACAHCGKQVPLLPGTWRIAPSNKEGVR